MLDMPEPHVEANQYPSHQHTNISHRGTLDAEKLCSLDGWDQNWIHSAYLSSTPNNIHTINQTAALGRNAFRYEVPHYYVLPPQMVCFLKYKAKGSNHSTKQRNSLNATSILYAAKLQQRQSETYFLCPQQSERAEVGEEPDPLLTSHNSNPTNYLPSVENDYIQIAFDPNEQYCYFNIYRCARSISSLIQ